MKSSLQMISLRKLELNIGTSVAFASWPGEGETSDAQDHES